MDDIYKRFKEYLERIKALLHKVPLELQDKLQKLLAELKDYVESNPELIEQTLPILINICTTLAEEKYAETLGSLTLLVILIRWKTRKKH